MKKTCYFCEEVNLCGKYCDTTACTFSFVPTADWLEYESLKKDLENMTRWRDNYRKLFEKSADKRRNLLDKWRALFQENEKLKRSAQSL